MILATPPEGGLFFGLIDHLRLAGLLLLPSALHADIGSDGHMARIAPLSSVASGHQLWEYLDIATPDPHLLYSAHAWFDQEAPAVRSSLYSYYQPLIAERIDNLIAQSKTTGPGQASAVIEQMKQMAEMFAPYMVNSEAKARLEALQTARHEAQQRASAKALGSARKTAGQLKN